MATGTTTERESGFEYDGDFYPWSVTDNGKDLQLIDRFTAMPVDEFFEVLTDERQNRRGSVINTMIATSLRARHPEWSVERIVKIVEETASSDFVRLNASEGDEQGPPAEAAAESEHSDEPADASSSSSTRAETSDSATSYATPV